MDASSSPHRYSASSSSRQHLLSRQVPPSPPSLPRTISFSTPEPKSRSRPVFDIHNEIATSSPRTPHPPPTTHSTSAIPPPSSARLRRSQSTLIDTPPPPPPPPLPSSRKLEQDFQILQFHNDAVALDFEKSRLQQEKQRVELDSLKEKLRKQKNEAELMKLEEQERKRSILQELDEARRETSALQQNKLHMEMELEKSQKQQQDLAEEIEKERERTQTKIDTAVRRALEKEELRWNNDHTEHVRALESELEECRQKFTVCERSRAQTQAECDTLKRLVQSLRVDSANEKSQLTLQYEERLQQRDLDVEQYKKRIAASDLAKKRMDTTVEEMRQDNNKLELDLQRERMLVQQEQALRRALEKEREERKTAVEQFEREEAKRRRAMEEEVKEARARLLQLETQVIPQWEHQCEDLKRELQEMQEQREEDHELQARKLDLACKRAVEREKQVWEESYALRMQQANEEIDDLKQHLRANEHLLAKQHKEMEEAKRVVDSIKQDCEREIGQIRFDFETKEAAMDTAKRALVQDVDSIKKKLQSSDAAKRKAEKDCEEAKRALVLLEEEIQLERTRAQQRTDLACLKQVERVRQEQRTALEQQQRQFEQERKSLQRDLDESKMQEIRLKQAMDELTLQLQQLHAEQERASARSQESIQALEFDHQQLLNEKRHLEQFVRTLEDESTVRWQEENALAHQLDESRAEVQQLRNDLQLSSQREEALLFEIDSMQRKSSHDFLHALENGQSQRRYLQPPTVAAPPRMLVPPPPQLTATRPSFRSTSTELPLFSRRPSPSSTPLSRRLAQAKRLLDD